MTRAQVHYNEEEREIVWRCHAADFQTASSAVPQARELEPDGYRLHHVAIRRRKDGKRVSLTLIYRCMDRRKECSALGLWKRTLRPVEMRVRY